MNHKIFICNNKSRVTVIKLGNTASLPFLIINTKILIKMLSIKKTNQNEFAHVRSWKELPTVPTFIKKSIDSNNNDLRVRK